MLKGIHPLLTGALLKVLDELGHGDSLVIADANFPAHATARAALSAGTNATAPVIELPGHSSPAVAAAICSVLPIDTYEGPAVTLMTAEPGVSLDVQNELIAATGEPQDRVERIERFAFYAAAESVAAVIRTGESRPYGNLILRKGVIN